MNCSLSRGIVEELIAHAVSTCPEECCGFLLYDPENDQETVRRIRNVATERHQTDPANFPRDGRDGYIMDEKELLEVNRALDGQSFELRCIYHSHPNGKAYFSKNWRDERKAFASIRDDLGQLYSLSYYPKTNPNHGWRNITVKLMGEHLKNYHVRTRNGYRPQPNRFSAGNVTEPAVGVPASN